MRAIFLAAVLVSMPAAVLAQAMPGDPTDRTKPVRIVIDNSDTCARGRIGEYRRENAARIARAEASRLRARGFTVDVVTRNAGFELSSPRNAFRTYTASC